jgi:hypothetical protein
MKRRRFAEWFAAFLADRGTRKPSAHKLFAIGDRRHPTFQ